jgi:hypothetical protein
MTVEWTTVALEARHREFHNFNGKVEFLFLK